MKLHHNHNNTYTSIGKRHKAHNGTADWLLEICAWKNIVGKMIRLYQTHNVVVSVEAKRFVLEILLSRKATMTIVAKERQRNKNEIR